MYAYPIPNSLLAELHIPEVCPSSTAQVLVEELEDENHFGLSCHCCALCDHPDHSILNGRSSSQEQGLPRLWNPHHTCTLDHKS